MGSLYDVVKNYNSQVNRSIGLPPKDVNEVNKWVVWTRLFGQIANIPKPKFDVGDTVRVLHFKPKYRGKKFQKYFRQKYPEIAKIRTHLVEAKDKPSFSEETFTIDKVLLDDPIVYKLYSPEADTEILGTFYENELSLVM